MQFYRLALGARFEFRGREYRKEAMSVARDSDDVGNVFQAGAEVIAIGKPLLLTEAEAERWRPSGIL
jgi:hypothetical protein